MEIKQAIQLSTGLIGYWKKQYTEGKLVGGKTENTKALEAKVKDWSRW